MFGPHYRFHVRNSTGVTLAVAGAIVRGKREKFASDGSLALEATEATLYSNAATIGSGAYVNGTTQDNTTDKYLGGTFLLTVTAPTGAAGDVTCWLQHSTDGGTTWPDDGTGILVAVVSFTATGTKRAEFRL